MTFLFVKFINFNYRFVSLYDIFNSLSIYQSFIPNVYQFLCYICLINYTLNITKHMLKIDKIGHFIFKKWTFLNKGLKLDQFSKRAKNFRWSHIGLEFVKLNPKAQSKKLCAQFKS